MTKAIEMKLTLYYPGNVEPARSGVYERKYPANYFMRGQSNRFCYWNGIRWHGAKLTPGEAFACRYASARQSLPWRGVAK